MFEQIISEHFTSLDNFRLFDLIFDVEPPFVGTHNWIKIFEKISFTRICNQIGIYLNQKGEGVWIFLYENGQKQSEGNYHNGGKEGLWITYHKNGQKASEGYYQNGEREGLWTFRNDQGQITDIEAFYNGRIGYL